jgi:hypothetical protein
MGLGSGRFECHNQVSYTLCKEKAEGQGVSDANSRQNASKRSRWVKFLMGWRLKNELSACGHGPPITLPPWGPRPRQKSQSTGLLTASPGRGSRQQAARLPDHKAGRLFGAPGAGADRIRQQLGQRGCKLLMGLGQFWPAGLRNRSEDRDGLRAIRTTRCNCHCNRHVCC